MANFYPLVLTGTQVEELQTGDALILQTPASGTLTNCTGLPASTGITGTLPVANGGTGLTTYTQGDLVYASATNTLGKIADVATGNALISGGVGADPSWGKVGLTTHVSGTLPVANGGTNASSASITAFNNITGYTATGATGTTSTNIVFSTSPSITTATLTNPTITNYTETLFTATGSTTIALSNGTIQKITTSGSTTITLPSSTTGKSFTVIVSYAAADSITWAGGSTLKWASGTTPTPTSATGKLDIFNFYQDGTNTYGSVFGQNY
jgi:hypothetical protein